MFVHTSEIFLIYKFYYIYTMRTTIKLNSKGEDVKYLQQLLGLTADSTFGPKTDAAVKKFQKEHGLVADGIVGAKTWAELEKLNTTKPVSSTVNSKKVDSSVIYSPLKCCLTKLANRQIKYIAIHYTAGSSSKPGTAISMKNYWESVKKSSADFGVDDRDIYQFNPDPKNYYCWSVGDKKAAHVNVPDGRNSNTISIEICSTRQSGTRYEYPNHTGWSYTDKVLENAIKLTKILMKKFNIPVERVIRHYDISGKICPGLIGWNDGPLYDTNGKLIKGKRNTSDKWQEFKNKLK